MARKRHRKWKRQRQTREQEGDGNQISSLEEDLRLQRIRQQERQALKKQEVSHEETVAEYDGPDLSFDTPSSSMASSSLPQYWTFKRGPWPKYVPEISSIHGLFAARQSPHWNNPRQKRRLAYWTASKHILENLHIDRRAATMYSRKIKWADHELPTDMYSSGDMTCKYYLHPSARSLDVAQMPDGDSNGGRLPTVATTLQGGWGLYQPATGHRESRVHTSRCKPVHAIRIHEKSQTLGTVIRDDYSTASNKFQWRSLPHAVNYIEADLPTPVHDFVFGNDLAIFACPRYGGRSTLFPLFLPLDHPSNTTVRSLNVQNFPQSDALRVEMSCQHEKYLAFGHRNGQVSLLDLRQNHTCSAIISSENGSPTEMGSATDLAFLSSQTQLLIKRSFGPCELHDLRKLSPCPSSLIHTLSIPEYEGSSLSFHKTLSANCNGFCVDPLTENTLISPFVNQFHEPCLGSWSLSTGDMVGCKVLYRNPRREVYYTELCSRTTPSFRPKLDPSSFGLWMKCGRFSEEKVCSKGGSLHHLSFPGRYIPLEE